MSGMSGMSGMSTTNNHEHVSPEGRVMSAEFSPESSSEFPACLDLAAIPCVRDCGRRVDPSRGGAFCTQCTAVDLTGGVAPSDLPAPAHIVMRIGPGTRGRGRRGPGKRADFRPMHAWAARYAAGESLARIAASAGVAPRDVSACIEGLVQRRTRRAS